MESTLSQDWRRDHDYAKIYDYLHDFVGVSKRQKLMDDLSDFLYFGKLEWAAKRRVKFSPEVCLVTVTEPETGEILDLGGTLPGDLFVDNYGTMLAGQFSKRSNNDNTQAFTLKNQAGTSRTTAAFYSASGSTLIAYTGDASGAGVQFQIGSGTTAPARSDVTIQTAFSTAPENALFAGGTGSYTNGSGTTTISGNITAGNESATINEATLVMRWVYTGTGTGDNFTVCHDATTATAFSNAKSITIQYSISD